MGLIWQAITDKSCVNCIHMPEGYYCQKLKKRFDGHEIDKGVVPCKGEHFEHYMKKQPLKIHIVDREGKVIGVKECKGE